jgi:FlaG/FlaF family flagellin (archaellin)
MKKIENESAMSPVVGTLLLLAITVIFAVIVGALVFSMSDGFPQSKIIASTAYKPVSDKIVFTYHGGQGAETCKGVVWDISSVDNPSLVNHVTMGTIGAVTTILPVGSSTIAPAYSGQTHIVGTAYFTDETQQVILDKTL